MVTIFDNMSDFLKFSAVCTASQNALCQNQGYANPKNCAICTCPEGFGGTYCNGLQPAYNNANGAILTATTTFQTLSTIVGNNYNFTPLPPSPQTNESSIFWWIQVAKFAFKLLPENTVFILI
jgi:hypothetical protein